MERIYIKYDEDNKCLILEVTPKVAFESVKLLREKLPIPMLSAKLETVEVTSESGEYYKEVRRYNIPCLYDEVSFLFDAGFRIYLEGIKKSIPNSDN